MFSLKAPVPDSTVIEVDIPKITTDLGKQVHFVRFPNFLSVEARPFDPAMYEDEVEDDELLDEEGRARLKLKVFKCLDLLFVFADNFLIT